MSKRKEFLDSVHPDKVEKFLNFIKLHNDGSDPFDLSELVHELQRTQRVELWARVAALMRLALEAYPPDRWVTSLDDDSGDEMEVEVSADLTHTMAVLGGSTLVCTVSVGVVDDGEYTDLLGCVQMLNSIESYLPLSEMPLQQAIHWLFECWWRRGLRGKEELGWTAFVICLENTVTLKKPISELTRLHGLREVLLTVDFQSERGQSVADPLLQCFLSANHIKREEGKRFLAFLFGWDVAFIRMIHETIKNQLPFFSKADAVDVAEVYFRAWRKADSPFLEEIETSCVQDLMQHALMLPRASPVHSRVRQILTYFHQQKFRQGVDEMLHRLYKPILWKALKAVNMEVRANATLLFTEAFPVQDPGMSSERVDELVQKQLDMLFALLEDVRPLVRSTAVLGACSVLARCWELLPSVVITDLLKKILQVATDTSSPDSRCSVFMCMSVILDNRLSHPLMEKLLPALRSSLHDSSEKVRTAFVDMLLKIKAVRAAKFWKVCSMEDLLVRLEHDSAAVAKRIVNLLFSSFLPVSQSEEVWCERCVTMVQMNPGAARKFYRHAHLYTAPTNIVKLMLMIRKCLNTCIQRSTDSTDESVSSNKENTSVLEEVLSVKDKAVMASLLEIVVILWNSVQRSLELNQEALSYTTAKFSSVLPEYLRIFQEERCTAPLIRLASLLPAAAVPALRSKVLSQLCRMDSGSPVAVYSQLLECVCGWSQLDRVLELVVEWLSEAAPAEKIKSATQRVQFDDPVEAKPDLGLDYMAFLLQRPRTRECLLALPLKQLTPLLQALSAWKAVLFSCLSEGGGEDGVSAALFEMALSAFSLHTRLNIHLQHRYPEGRDFLGSLEHSLDWLEERVLSFLVAPGENVSEQQMTLAKRTVKTCLMGCRDAVRVAVGDADFNDHLLQLGSCVLLSEKGYVCLPLLVSVLTEVVLDTISHNGEEQEEQVSLTLRIITNIFQKVLEVLAHRLRRDKEEGQELCCSSVDVLQDFLLVTQLVSERSEFTSGIFSSLCAAVIIDISRALQKLSHPEEVMTPGSAADLPPLSATIITAILRSPAVTRCFLSELSLSVDSEAIESLAGLAAVSHILAIGRKAEKFQQDLKEIAASVHTQIHQHTATLAEAEHTQRVIYESVISTLSEVLTS